MLKTPNFYAKSRKEWRAWLKKNHRTKDKIYLIRYKSHTGKPSPTVRESMDEAICFGWIDTTVNRIDEDRYSICYRKRTPKGRWSHATLGYAKRLIKEKRMTPSGLKAYKLGLKNEVIDHGLPKNPDTPDDLKKALGKGGKHWKSLAPSYRKYSIYWIEKAVSPETRKRRIKAVVEACKLGQKTPHIGKN